MRKRDAETDRKNQRMIFGSITGCLGFPIVRRIIPIFIRAFGNSLDIIVEPFEH